MREADASIAYRITHPQFHRAFGPVLEELSGVAWPIDKKATEAKRKAATFPEKVKPAYVSFNAFANKAKATVLKQDGGEELWATIEQRALELSRTLAINAAPVERLSPYTQENLRKAEGWIADGDWDFIERKVSQFSDYVGGYDVKRDEDNHPEVESLARLITKFLAKKREDDLNAD